MEVISYISGADTLEIPAHQAGDLIIAFGRRAATDLLPIEPSGWTTLATSLRTNASYRLISRVSSTGDAFTLSFAGTSANSAALIVRGSSLSIGAVAEQNNFLPSITIPALTLVNASAWVLGVSFSLASFTPSAAFVPNSGGSAMNIVGLGADSAPRRFDLTTTMVSAWPGGTISINNSNASNVGFSVEIHEAGSAGDPPAGIPVIESVDPDTSTATVTYTYPESDATGFEYRLNSGSWNVIGASPAVITSLTPATTYSLELRAANGAGSGSASSSTMFTTDAAALDWVVLPGVTSVTTNSITVSATPNQASDVYAVALRTTSPEPTAQQILNGLDGNGDPAAASGSAVSNGSAVSITLSGLTDDPTYNVRLVAHIN